MAKRCILREKAYTRLIFDHKLFAVSFKQHIGFTPNEYISSLYL